MLSRLTPQHALPLQTPSTTFPRRMSSSFQEAAPHASPTGESSPPRLCAGGRPHRRGRGLCVHRLPLLAGAGLLQGRPATTHWAYRGFLDRLGARYVAERWVEDGRYLTGAGVSAGIDTALRLASRLASDEMSRLVQLAIEYDPALRSVGSTGPRLTATCFGRESKASQMRRSAITQTCSPGFSASGAQMPGRGRLSTMI